VVLPLKGMGPLPSHLTNPEVNVEVKNGWAKFQRNIKDNLKPEIRYIELDVTFNDPIYTKTVLELFDEMVRTY
jgi:hypothetical protein